ncbi:hypothetical protein Peur_027920 [Populus x canadensis]
MLVMNQVCRIGQEKRTLLRLLSYFENQIYLCNKVTVICCPGANLGVLCLTSANTKLFQFEEQSVLSGRFIGL